MMEVSRFFRPNFERYHVKHTANRDRDIVRRPHCSLQRSASKSLELQLCEIILLPPWAGKLTRVRHKYNAIA